MSGFGDMLLIGLKKAGYYGLQFLFVGLQWLGSMGRAQHLGGRKCGAKKESNKIHAALGAEVYAFYKRGGDAGWQKEPSIEHQLKRAEEAEASLLRADAEKETLKSDYLSKKGAIVAKYTAKRDALGSGS